MTNDELEYSISQYIDGTLPPVETAALEQRLAGDAEARGILAEYRKLDSVLKSAIPPPDVDWDQFSTSIIAAVSQEEAPVRHYSMKWVRTAATWAVAAVIFMAVGVTFRSFWKDAAPGSSGPVAVVPKPLKSVVQVAGPQARPLSGPPVQLVSIGRSNSHNPRDLQSRYTEGVVSRPSSVIIASSAASAQDNRPTMPY
jgi:anti-sigma factor RsiW